MASCLIVVLYKQKERKIESNQQKSQCSSGQIQIRDIIIRILKSVPDMSLIQTLSGFVGFNWDPLPRPRLTPSLKCFKQKETMCHFIDIIIHHQSLASLGGPLIQGKREI